MSPDAQTKVINTHKKVVEDDDDKKSSASAKSAKTMKSISKTMKSLEKDNRRLKKSECTNSVKRMMTMTRLHHLLRIRATSKRPSNFSMKHILKLHLL